MTRRLLLAILLAALGTNPGRALAFSAVFNGDPTDGAGTPLEILPGKPLVQPGADGILGTADDVITPSVVGDVDLVVRAGDVAAPVAIPAPALAGNRAALPSGVAGPRNAGGTEIPFTVFLSTGVTGAGEAAGRLLAAPDMDGLPVIVAAFPDLDGDGVIGPTTAGNDAAHALQLQELEPVGRAAALFSGGIAHGSLAVRRALPASQGGLTVALVGLAVTGPLDPGFFDGAIPSGPAIATALPFLPQRDLNRLIRDRAVPAGPGTTLQQLVQFSAPPGADVYALPLDGSEASIDGAVVRSQPAVSVALRDGAAPRGIDLRLDRLTLGSQRFASLAELRLVPVDRFDNPADAVQPVTVRVFADGPLRLLSPRKVRRGDAVLLRNGTLRIAGRVPDGAPDGSSGTVRVERDGVVIATLPYTVDAAANVPRADVTVPSGNAPTIQAAIDGATDRNRDGRIVIAVRAGVYRESVVIGRPLTLVGAGRDVTILQGDGSAPVLAATTAGVVVRGLTALGGTRGFELVGPGARVVDSVAWGNVQEGALLAGAATELRQCEIRRNGGDGVRIAAGDGVCQDSWIVDNAGNGANAAAANTAWIGNRIAFNHANGVFVQGVGGATVSGNGIVLNTGTAVFLESAPNAVVTDNVCAVNDEDGLHLDRSDGTSATGNALQDNNGYGIFLRRSNDTDFAAAPGLQAPPGDNEATGNRKEDVFVRTN